MDRVNKAINLPFKYHLVAGFLIRLFLILYGEFHDKNYDVPYTDVDYKVFTDAARHVIKGDSPYKRHTYRYSPIIAYLMIPNVVIDKNFGKILFSVFDILVALAVKSLVEHQLGINKKNVTRVAIYCSIFWLYNPLSIGISTRGNADSVPCFLVILSLLFLQKDAVNGIWTYVASGALLGISIHLRLYPLVFTFPMYLSLGKYTINRSTTIKDGFLSLLPSMNQLTLVSSCVATLFAFTYGMYLLYGYEFLFETYIYHLFRNDTKHNFSIFFYYSYITIDQLAFDIVKTVAQIFECLTLFAISLTFGCDPQTLPFALFCQAVVLVSFNSVLTSQYFIWFLSLLPLVVHNFKVLPAHALFFIVLWFSGQGFWLYYAYLLEFQCEQVFIQIWLKGVVFFFINIFVLGQLIESYTPSYGFGQINLISKENKSK